MSLYLHLSLPQCQDLSLFLFPFAPMSSLIPSFQIRERLYCNQEEIKPSRQVPGDLRTLGARQGITIGELAEEFSVIKKLFIGILEL
jgi:hypothetical protein